MQWFSLKLSPSSHRYIVASSVCYSCARLCSLSWVMLGEVHESWSQHLTRLRSTHLLLLLRHLATNRDVVESHSNFSSRNRKSVEDLFLFVLAHAFSRSFGFIPLSLSLLHSSLVHIGLCGLVWFILDVSNISNMYFRMVFWDNDTRCRSTHTGVLGSRRLLSHAKSSMGQRQQWNEQSKATFGAAIRVCVPFCAQMTNDEFMQFCVVCPFLFGLMGQCSHTKHTIYTDRQHTPTTIRRIKTTKLVLSLSNSVALACTYSMQFLFPIVAAAAVIVAVVFFCPKQAHFSGIVRFCTMVDPA